MNTRSLITICAAGLLLLTATSALASRGQAPHRSRSRQAPSGQERTGREQPPALPDSVQIAAMVAELGQAVQLSADQEARISDLYFAHFNEVKAAQNRESGNREDHRRQMESLRSDFEKSVKALLTDEQKAAFEKHVAQRRPGPRR